MMPKWVRVNHLAA